MVFAVFSLARTNRLTLLVLKCDSGFPAYIRRSLHYYNHRPSPVKTFPKIFEDSIAGCARSLVHPGS